MEMGLQPLLNHHRSLVSKFSVKHMIPSSPEHNENQ